MTVSRNFLISDIPSASTICTAWLGLPAFLTSRWIILLTVVLDTEQFAHHGSSSTAAAVDHPCFHQQGRDAGFLETTEAGWEDSWFRAHHGVPWPLASSIQGSIQMLGSSWHTVPAPVNVRLASNALCYCILYRGTCTKVTCHW